MTDHDLLDRTLNDAFNRAHADPRWAGEAWTDPLRRVRRASRSASTRRAGAASVAIAATAVGVGVGLHTLTPGEQTLKVPFANGGTGIDSSGLDWLLTPTQFDTYAAAHPSPSPSRDIVASPAPMSDELRNLVSDVFHALPDGVTMPRIDAADGGDNGHAVVWARLADGTPVAVERYRLDYPIRAGDDPAYLGSRATASPSPIATVSDQGPSESYTDPATWSDQTAYTVVTGDRFGYGFDANTQWSGPIVWTVTADGWFTSWTAPVSTEQLLAWAHAGDTHFTSSSSS